MPRRARTHLARYVKSNSDVVFPTNSAPEAAKFLRDMNSQMTRSRDLKQHVRALGRLSDSAHKLSEEDAAEILRIFEINPGFVAIRELMFGEMSYRLAAVGHDAILAYIAQGRSLGEVASALRLPSYLLYQFLTSTKKHEEALRSAISASGFVFAEWADAAAIDNDPNLARHWRWRAERAAPEYFAKRNPRDEADNAAVFNLTIDMSQEGREGQDILRQKEYERAMRSIGEPIEGEATHITSAIDDIVGVEPLPDGMLNPLVHNDTEEHDDDR